MSKDHAANQLPAVRTILVVWTIIAIPTAVMRYVSATRFPELASSAEYLASQVIYICVSAAYWLFGPLLARRILEIQSYRQIPHWISIVLIFSTPVGAATRSLVDLADGGTSLADAVLSATVLVADFFLLTCLINSTTDVAVRRGRKSSDRLESLGEQIPGLSGAVQASVIGRARDAERLSTVMIVAIVCLVVVGGGASLGTWQASQLTSLKKLEEERARATELADRLAGSLREAGTRNTAFNHLSESLSEVVRESKDVLSAASLKSTVDDVKQRLETTRWEDIAIRGTIALLTIFLVQIFFSVYKYHRRLGHLLSDKAEALALISEDEGARRLLRRELAVVVKGSGPDFGRGPNSPVERVLDLAEERTRVKRKDE